jgi:hypothetical protein
MTHNHGTFREASGHIGTCKTISCGVVPILFRPSSVSRSLAAHRFLINPWPLTQMAHPAHTRRRVRAARVFISFEAVDITEPLMSPGKELGGWTRDIAFPVLTGEPLATPSSREPSEAQVSKGAHY